ncbi:hypothetical protein H6F88_04595 [Oculatella sp. FACHB-28]|nr:hypothetical protein [Oculatella sp. FACHB-28]
MLFWPICCRNGSEFTGICRFCGLNHPKSGTFLEQNPRPEDSCTSESTAGG